MANTGWTADALNVTYPPGAVPPTTFIYIGDADGDPYGALTAAGLDAGLVLYFGTRPYSYVLGIFQEFVGDVVLNDGHLYLVGVDPDGSGPNIPDLTRILETDWQPFSAGDGANTLEIADSTVSLRINAADITMNSSGGPSGDDVRIAAQGIVELGWRAVFPGNLWPTNIDGEFFIRNNEQGWGIWNSTGSSSNSAAIGTTETTILTFPSQTYIHGRAYRLYLHQGIFSNTAAASCYVGFKKTNPAGISLGDLLRIPTPSSGTAYGFHGVAEFTVGATDVTATLVITIVSTAGTMTATAGRTATIEDIGTSSQVTSAALVLS